MSNKVISKKSILSYSPFLFGVILTLLFALKSLSPIVWGLVASLFLLSCIISIFINNQNILSLIVIFVYQIVLKIPLHFKNILYIFQPDEAYHLGYSLILSLYQQFLPVERMIGYVSFPVLDMIVSSSIWTIGLTSTIIVVKIINSILVGLLTVFFVDKTFQLIFQEKKRLATFIFTSCYKFLFFSSLYVYEAITFLLIVLATYIIVSLYGKHVSNKQNTIRKTLKYLALIVIFALLGFWHYFSYFLSFFLIALYFITQNEIMKNKNQTNEKDSKSKILDKLSVVGLTLILIIALNVWIMINNGARGHVASYFYSSLSSLNVIEMLREYLLHYSRIFVLIIETILFISIFVGSFLIKKLMTITSKYKSKLASVVNFKTYLILSTIILGIGIATYVGYSKNLVGGLNTTQNLGILSFLAILGLFFFVFNVLIYPVSDSKRNPLLISFYILFALITLIFGYLMLNDIFSRIFGFKGITNPIINELSHRLIPYMFFFGCMFFMHYEKYLDRVSEYIRRLFVYITTKIFRILKSKENGKHEIPSFKKLISTKNLAIGFVFLFSIQAIALSPWQIYHSELNIPEDDLYAVSEWLRDNLDHTSDFIFVEYMYRSIAAYSFLNVPDLDDITATVLLSMYYQRNFTYVINTLSFFNCSYFIYDLVGLDTDYMTKVARDKYLISLYNVNPDVLEFYDDSIPLNEEIQTVFSTGTLLVLKINSSTTI